jgi:hypothetical protein
MWSPTARNLVRSSSRSAPSLVLITRKGSSLAEMMMMMMMMV